KIFVTANTGDIHVIRAGRTFEKLATNKMNEPTMATPAISDGRLFVRTRSELYCIGEEKP
ncbi:MAG: outer membrane protein assembly factor BamB, partial [Limisphaerales bacterium]